MIQPDHLDDDGGQAIESGRWGQLQEPPVDWQRVNQAHPARTAHAAQFPVAPADPEVRLRAHGRAGRHPPRRLGRHGQP
jgi:hypothetical protein